MAEFVVVGGARHKALRIALESHGLRQSNQTKKNLAIAHKAVDSHLNYSLSIVCQKVFTGLKGHFDDRCHPYLHPPRFCIKLRRGDNVYTYARDSAVDIDRSEKAFQAARETNTGFDKVANEGRPFFENNLPALAKAARYKNPRLDPARATSYSPSWSSPVLDRFSAIPVDDQGWINCWDDGRGGRPSAAACYKSTLIVPMTLLHHQVSSEFREHFGLHGSLLPKESEKFNFGFLCVDSHHVDFFEEQDKEWLFTYADLFCMFLISAYTFREHSRTFADAERILTAAGNTVSRRAQPRRRKQ